MIYIIGTVYNIPGSIGIRFKNEGKRKKNYKSDDQMKKKFKNFHALIIMNEELVILQEGK